MIKFHKKKKAVVRVSWALIYALFFNAALPFSLFATGVDQSGAVSEGYLESSYVDDNSWIEQYISRSSGNNSFTEERLSISCPGVSLELDLTYESISSHPDNGIGTHWTHSYEWVLVNDDSGKALHTGDGSKYIFDAVSGGYDSPDGLSWSLEVVPNGYEVQLPGGKTYLLDSTGRLDAIADAWGNSVQCNYDTNDCLSVVQHDNGRQLVFTNGWNATLQEWRVQSVTVPNGASLSFSYDPDGQFTQVVEQVGNNSYTSIYEYADGLLTNRVDAAGVSYAYDYEAGTDGKCTNLSVDGNLEYVADYVSDDVTDIISTMRGLEQRFRYSRNSDGMLETKYGPATNTTLLSTRGSHYEYATNNVDKIEKTLFDNNTGATWSKWMLYDDAHNMINLSMGYNTTNPVQQISMKYDPLWEQLSSVTDAEGDRTEMGYTNGSVRVYKEFYSDVESHNTHFSYSTNGLLRAITNANGHVTLLAYNLSGDLVNASAEAGPIVSNSYNSLGFIETTETLDENGESTGRITQYDVDQKGRIVSVTNPGGVSSSFKYNALGYLTNIVDHFGRVSEYKYTPVERLTSVTKYLHQNGSNVPVRVSFNYDEQFNTLSVTEPRGRYVESYQLDIQDRITAVTNVEGQVMTLDYSVGSFVTNFTRFDQSRLDISYDSVGRRSEIAYIPAGGSAASLTVSRDYYADGQLKTLSDGSTSVSNEYDRLNRLTNVVTTIDNLQSSISNAYDPVGNLTNSVVDMEGANSVATTYSYDTAERLTGISTTEGHSFQYGYNPENGRVSSVTNLESGLVSTYAYDLMDRATNISYRTSTVTLIRSLDYKFDAIGMITEKIISSPSNTVVHSYAYDSIDRLIFESRTAGILPASSAQYLYDLAGNRLAKTSNGWKTECTLGSGNRLASSQTTAFTNSLFISGQANEPIGTDDRWGELWITNLTSSAGVVPSVNGSTFAAEIPSIGNATNTVVAAIRDRAGNMGYATNTVWVSSATGGTNETQSFEYNAAGCLTNLNGTALTWDERYRLTSAVQDSLFDIQYSYDVLGRKVSRTAGILPAEVEHYVYDGNQVVADFDGSNNVLRTYVWGSGIDNLLAITIHPASTNSTPLMLYPIKDHQNTVLALVDEDGAIVESYEYDAWGNVSTFDSGGTEIDDSNIGNRYLFQGREYDFKTGFYYFRARWYNPETGRWLSKDPIGIAGGLNLYAFCGNNPVNFVDPTGESWSVVALCAGGVATLAFRVAMTTGHPAALVVLGVAGAVAIVATVLAAKSDGKTIDKAKKMLDEVEESQNENEEVWDEINDYFESL